MRPNLLLRLLPLLLLVPTGCVRDQDPAGDWLGDEVLVSWQAAPSLAGVVPPGLTPLVFTFSPASEALENGVTLADWRREAGRQGTSVEALQMALGGSAYLTANGHLAACTPSAHEAALCGQPLSLSLTQRSWLAEEALEATGLCDWRGFDPVFNIQARDILQPEGAEGDSVLHVAAAC